ncbi:MAG: SIS domain-containing protein [Oscillospiraceae bacterium]|nr:SIS domain-containing protein [Oscillospiraceae bacterium]
MSGIRENAFSALGEIKQVFERLNEDDVMPALKAIAGARRVICYAGGREGLGLKFFVMRLMHLGKDAHWAWDDTAPSCGEGDVFVVSSGSGRFSHIFYTAEQAKKRGATLVAITATPDGDFARLADHVVFLPAMAYRATGNLVPTKQPMGNLYEQSALLMYDMFIIALQSIMNVSKDEMEARHRNYE